MPTTKPASLPSRATVRPSASADDREDEAGDREREPLLDGLHLLVRRDRPFRLLVGGLPQSCGMVSSFMPRISSNRWKHALRVEADDELAAGTGRSRPACRPDRVFEYRVPSSRTRSTVCFARSRISRPRRAIYRIGASGLRACRRRGRPSTRRRRAATSRVYRTRFGKFVKKTWGRTSFSTCCETTS